LRLLVVLSPVVATLSVRGGLDRASSLFSSVHPG
jgi:hypothetical protein